MSDEMASLALMGLLVICALDAGAARGPILGVFIRPEGTGDQTPEEVAGRLRSNEVGAVFYLTRFPAREDEKARIMDLKSALGPDIELHLWLTVYRNARYSEEHPEEAFVSNEPLPEEGWISPTSAPYRQDLLEAVEDLGSTIQPRGFLLDYFHVPFGPFDNETMEAFSAHAGSNLTFTVANLTADPNLLGRFLEWRNDAMIGTLGAIREVTDGARLSIFVLMMEEGERLLAGQDLDGFSDLADFLVPNTYHINYLRGADWVGDGVRVLKALGAESVWPGIQAYDIEPREIRRAIRAARKGGADGVVLFRYGTMDEEHWEQVRRGYQTGLNPALVIPAGGIGAAVAGALVWRRRRQRSVEEAKIRSRRKRKHRKR